MVYHRTFTRVTRSPKIVKFQTDHNSLTLNQIENASQYRVVSKETAAHVLSAMESVVTEGTGRLAYIRGYRVGGKTGTAQIPLENGRGYKDDAYIASFVGAFPIQAPKYVIYIAINEPQTTIWGSTAAAPLFKQIGERILDFYPISPN